jgi:coenzyme PQQ synthesis protein D (PqqD)
VNLMPESSIDAALLGGKARVPAHVVFRSFPHETVVLNLDTGKYHGLNPTAGRMLEVLNATDTVDLAAERLAVEYMRPLDEIRRDLYDLCEQLRARGLLEIQSSDGSAT